jgi:hypothetical protein
MHPFRAAIEATDAEAAAAVLADVFRSPIVFKPYAGQRAEPDHAAADRRHR